MSSSQSRAFILEAAGRAGLDIFMEPALGVSGSRSGAGSVQADSARGADQPVIHVEAEGL